MSGVLMSTRRRAVAGAIQTPLTVDDFDQLLGVGASQSTAGCTFITDGDITKVSTGSNQEWFAPIQSGIGSSYWIIVSTPSSGTFTTSPTLNVRNALSTNRAFTVTTTGSATVRSKSVVAAYQLWDAASGGTQVGAGSIELSANVDNL